MEIDKTYFSDDRTRVFVPYKGWLIEDSEGDLIKDELTLSSQDLGPLERVSIAPKDSRSHWTYNLLDKRQEHIIPNNCSKISWHPQGYYIAYYDNMDDLSNHRTDKFVHGYWIVKEDGSLLSTEPFLEAAPATFNRIAVVLGNDEEYILSLDGAITPSSTIQQIGASGWYVFEDNKTHRIIDNKGHLVVKDIVVITYDSELLIVRKEGTFLVYDYNKNVIGEFTSMLKSDPAVWNIQFYHRNQPKVMFWHGDPKNEILNYAQQLLISRERLALLEKHGIWYYFDTNHRLIECFRFNPTNIILR